MKPNIETKSVKHDFNEHYCELSLRVCCLWFFHRKYVNLLVTQNTYLGDPSIKGNNWTSDEEWNVVAISYIWKK
jgi:hypothetical protein